MVRKGGQATAKQLAALTHRFPKGPQQFYTPRNKGMRGRWKRPDNLERGGGWNRPGQPGRYRGGAVKWHLPTSPNGNVAALAKSRPHPMQFGQPGAEVNRLKGGGRPKSKECRCLEEIQNGGEEPELLTRYPPRMVKRLLVLARLSEDGDHRDCLKAQQMLREILRTNQGDRPDPSQGGNTITLLHGVATPPPLPGADPLPGAAPADGEPVEGESA